MSDRESLHKTDLTHLWHPFTDINSLQAGDWPIIERAEGVCLHDTDGREYLDGISSWWCVNLGHRHPRLLAAARAQLDVLDQSILGGMSHPNAIRLAERLASVTPDGLVRTFFASDGASAVEAALKIALQYWANLGRPERHRFVSLVDGYHGDTLGAVGVGYVEAFHRSFRPAVIRSLEAASPHCFHCPHGLAPADCGVACFASMERIVRESHEQLAAVIIEPICQGLADGIARLANLPCVHRTASLGMMSAVEIAESAGGASLARRAAAKALEAGLFIRPLGGVLYLWPPLTTTVEQVERMVDLMAKALTDAEHREGTLGSGLD